MKAKKTLSAVFLLLFYFSFLSGFRSFAQSELDSLALLIKTETNDSIKLEALMNFTAGIADTYPDSAFMLLEQAETILAKSPNLNLELEVLNYKSKVLQNIGKYPESLQLLFKAKNLLESDPELLTDTLNIKNYLQTISNIGVLFYNIDKYQDAIDYFQTGLDYLANLDFDASAPWVRKEYFRFNLNYGAVYTKINEFEKAEVYYTKGMHYLDESELRHYAILLNNLSIVARETGSLEKAFDLNFKAIEICKEGGFYRELTQAYNNLGNCYFETLELKKAMDSYNKAIEIANKYDYLSSTVISLEMLSKIADTLGDYKTAYETYVKYKNLSDSLQDLEKVRLITQLEMQEKFDKRMNEALILQKEREAEQHKRELLYWLLFVFVLLILLIVVLLFYLQRSKIKRQHLEFEKSTLLNKSLGIEKKALEEELEFRNKELATNVMYMIRKNELITQISEKLIKSKLAFKKENQKIIDEIIKDLQSSTDDDVWKEFEIRFQQVHNDFYETLNERFPNLSSNEKRLSAFLRLNMSTKEISAITYQSVNSLTVARSRLRKKLNLDSDENLISFLATL